MNKPIERRRNPDKGTEPQQKESTSTAQKAAADSKGNSSQGAGKDSKDSKKSEKSETPLRAVKDDDAQPSKKPKKT